MALALAIFSVVVFPLVTIPIRAVDKGIEAKSSQLANDEILTSVSSLQSKVNAAQSFMPMTDLVNFDPRRQLFFAFIDPKTGEEKRVGYAFKDITTAAGGCTGNNECRWQMVETDIPVGANPDTYNLASVTNDRLWRSSANILYGRDYYIKSTPQTAPRFSYCIGGSCYLDPNNNRNNDVNPCVATAVRIQSNNATNGSEPGALTLVYKDSEIKVPASFFRLGVSRTNMALDEDQILPFSFATGSYGPPPINNPDTSGFGPLPLSSVDPNSPGRLIGYAYYNKPSWIAERTIQPNTTNEIRLPVRFQNLYASANDLPKTDAHYDAKLNKLTMATHSYSGRTYYVFQSEGDFNPIRMPANGENFRPYESKAPYGIIWGNLIGGEYTAPPNFPIVVRQGDAAWPPLSAGQTSISQKVVALSVTADSEGNIYVLLKSGSGVVDSTTPLGNFGNQRHWIVKFSPDGSYVSRFALPNSTNFASVIGITYDTRSTSDLVVLQMTNEGYRLLYYPKDQNSDDPDSVRVSGQSPVLSALFSASTLFPAPNWAAPRGVEYDAIHNRFLFAFDGNTTSPGVQVLSIDGNFTTNAWLAPPASRARFINNLFSVISSNATPSTPLYRLVNGPASGIAYNPNANQVILSAQGRNAASHIYFITPSIRLNQSENN